MSGLSTASADILLRAIQVAAGREICAVLLEGASGEQDVLCLENADALPGSFHVTDLELERAGCYARQQEMHVAAFIHSHSSSLELSDSDRRSQRPGALPWLVVMVADGKLHWRRHQASRAKHRRAQQRFRPEFSQPEF